MRASVRSRLSREQRGAVAIVTAAMLVVVLLAVAFVVDDIASVDPWVVRGVEIRGTAEALTDVDPPRPTMSREIIRITPRRIISWGLGGPFSARDV